jgi:hypothetical protein
LFVRKDGYGGGMEEYTGRIRRRKDACYSIHLVVWLTREGEDRDQFAQIGGIVEKTEEGSFLTFHRSPSIMPNKEFISSIPLPSLLKNRHESDLRDFQSPSLHNCFLEKYLHINLIA